MSCRQCEGIEKEFDAKHAARELQKYRRRGAIRSTRILIDELRPAAAGATLLDIGGGIGAIHHVLLDAGAQQATQVDVSPAFIDAAHDEALRRGHGNRVVFQRGDFVALAPRLPDADVVTLDRVICCYPNMPALAAAAADKARHMLGAVYPRDNWWIRLGVRCVNLLMRLRRSDFRVFAHSPNAIEAVFQEHGLDRLILHRTFAWEVAVFRRRP